jgi:hypothetical protein
LILSGIRERSARLETIYRDFLADTVNSPAQHALFLNMLSLLEHIGSRKIMLSQMGGALSESLLQHLAEETRHAFFFKRQARRFAGQDVAACTDDNTMARSAAAMYFARLDAEISKRVSVHCPKPDALYLAVSLIVELRACWAYPLYHAALEKAGIPLSLKSIIAEEDAHLEEMYEHFIVLPGAQNLSLAEMSAFETKLFERFLLHLTKASKVRRAA